MRSPYIILVILLIIGQEGQAQSFNKNTRTDTIKLEDVNFKKVLAYRINSVIILVDFNEFMKSFIPFMKKFKRGVKSLNRGTEKAIDENPSYVGSFLRSNLPNPEESNRNK